MGRVIALQGFAQDSRDQINDEPKSTEIWGLNNGYKFLRDPKRAKKWVQIHPRNWNSNKAMPAGEYGREPGHVEWLSKFKGELFIQAPDERIPNGTVYPLEEVTAFLNKRLNRSGVYLTSTFAYMIALVLLEHSKARGAQKVSELKIYGINLSTFEEYFNQRPCVEMMLGMAMGMGIKVSIPATSAIFRGRGYARDEDADMAEMARQRVEFWRLKHQQYRDAMTSASYVIQELKSWIATIQQEPGMDTISVMERRLEQVRTMSRQLSAQVEGTAASYREAQHFLSSAGQVHIPNTEFMPLELGTGPIGYDKGEVNEDAGSKPDSAGVGANAEPVAAG